MTQTQREREREREIHRHTDREQDGKGKENYDGGEGLQGLGPGSWKPGPGETPCSSPVHEHVYVPRISYTRISER